MAGLNPSIVSRLVRIRVPVGVSRKADDIALPGSFDGIHYVADDHGLDRDIDPLCLVRAGNGAQEALAV